MASRWGNNVSIVTDCPLSTVTDFPFLGSKITVDGDCCHETKRCLLLGRKAMTNLYSVLKSRDITLPTKVHTSQSYGFFSSHLWMGELDHKESWVPKKKAEHFWTVMLEEILERPLNWKKIKLVNPKENQSWMLIGRTDAEAEILILQPPHSMS